MTGDTIGGVWTHTLELSRALQPYGVEVILAAMGGTASSAQRAEAERISNLHLHNRDYRLEWMDDPWLDIEASARWLLSLEAHYMPDLIHLNTLGHGSLPWRAPIVLTAHSCVLSWWTAVRRTPVPPIWARYRECVEQSLGAANFITAPSLTMLNTLAENYHIPIPSSLAVANGRGAARYRSAEKEPFVLTAGRIWDEAKNAAAVARVARSLEWPVYFAGEHRHPSGSPAIFPGCRMLGHLSEEQLAGWYSRAAIYALPARYEPFGLSALEAALSGCALVLGDIPSLREVWADAAVYVPPDDDERLALALRSLIGDPAYRCEMARRSAARARRFTPDKMAQEYLAIYEMLAARKRTLCVS
jgi:glycosyltransferase involved in cell wall biosynthesis